MNTKVSIGLAALVAFILGAGAMWFFQQDDRPTGWSDRTFDGMFDERFFSSSPDPFQEMDRMQKRMDQLFEGDTRDTFTRDFDRWFDKRYGDLEPQTVRRIERSDAIEYRLDVGRREVVDLEVDVTNGIVTIEAELRQSEGNEISVSTITQRFPAPAGVDAHAFTVDQSKNAVTIRFPKK